MTVSKKNPISATQSSLCPAYINNVFIYLLKKNLLGRVHGAAVSGIDTDRRIVSVEWFEGGETKGKEVG